MAFVDSLPSNSSSDGSSNCTTEAAKSLTDNGTSSRVVRAGGSSIDTSACYGGSIATYNWADIDVSGAEITGVRFTVDVAATVNNLATAMQYQISIDGGSSFTSLASLDLTGAPVPPSGTTTQFHTTASETELYGLDWSGLSQADINSGNQVIFRWYINDSEPADGALYSDYTKIGIYSADPPPLPKSLSINSLLTLNGKLTIK